MAFVWPELSSGWFAWLMDVDYDAWLILYGYLDPVIKRQKLVPLCGQIKQDAWFKESILNYYGRKCGYVSHGGWWRPAEQIRQLVHILKIYRDQRTRDLEAYCRKNNLDLDTRAEFTLIEEIQPISVYYVRYLKNDVKFATSKWNQPTIKLNLHGILITSEDNSLPGFHPNAPRYGQQNVKCLFKKTKNDIIFDAVNGNQDNVIVRKSWSKPKLTKALMSY